MVGKVHVTTKGFKKKGKNSKNKNLERTMGQSPLIRARPRVMAPLTPTRLSATVEAASNLVGMANN